MPDDDRELLTRCPILSQKLFHSQTIPPTAPWVQGDLGILFRKGPPQGVASQGKFHAMRGQAQGKEGVVDCLSSSSRYGGVARDAHEVVHISGVCQRV